MTFFDCTMSTQIWLEKAERLRAQLQQLKAAQFDQLTTPTRAETEFIERVAIAEFLRGEFSDERLDDTATALLPFAAT